MAALRKLEEDYAGQFTVTAAAPMSGPYSISGVMKGLILGDQAYFTSVFIPYFIIGYQEIYGDLFTDLGEIFKPNYVPIIDDFYQPDYSLGSIGQALVFEMFSSSGGAIPKYMFQDSILDQLENNPDHRLNQVLRDNDNYNWVPQTPTRMFYCTGDEVVPFQNSIEAHDYMNANGAPDAMAVNAGTGLGHGDCAAPAAQMTIDFFDSFLPVGIDDPIIDNTFGMITPNPANNSFRFLIDDVVNEDIDLTIFTANGRKVIDIDSYQNHEHIDISALPPGTYFVKAGTDQTVSTHRLVVVK